jgi:hypothetical protein
MVPRALSARSPARREKDFVGQIFGLFGRARIARDVAKTRSAYQSVERLELEPAFDIASRPPSSAMAEGKRVRAAAAVERFTIRPVSRT